MGRLEEGEPVEGGKEKRECKGGAVGEYDPSTLYLCMKRS
jgi:hypothetical protein